MCSDIMLFRNSFFLTCMMWCTANGRKLQNKWEKKPSRVQTHYHSYWWVVYGLWRTAERERAAIWNENRYVKEIYAPLEQIRNQFIGQFSVYAMVAPKILSKSVGPWHLGWDRTKKRERKKNLTARSILSPKPAVKSPLTLCIFIFR